MTTKTHAALAIIFCSTTCTVIFTTGVQLVGLLHGPLDETHALDQHQSVQAKLAIAKQQHTLPWRESAELIFEPYEDMAYRDHSALILRDAGVVAAFFTLILVLVPNFTSICYSKIQRMCFAILALLLYITPGLVGQVLFQKTAPIEMTLLKSWGPARGFSYIGYCSIKSLLVGPGADGSSTIFALFHEFKVVMSAGFLVFLILGLVPPE